MGASCDQLNKVKHVQYVVFVAYHLSFETCYLVDEGATLVEFPLKSQIIVASPDKHLSLDIYISMIFNFVVPILKQNESEKMYKTMPIFLTLEHEPMIVKNKGESKPPLISEGMGPPISQVTSKYSPNRTSVVQT